MAQRADDSSMSYSPKAGGEEAYTEETPDSFASSVRWSSEARSHLLVESTSRVAVAVVLNGCREHLHLSPRISQRNRHCKWFQASRAEQET